MMVISGKKMAAAAGIAVVLNLLAMVLFFSSDSVSSSGWAVLSLPESSDEASSLEILKKMGLRSVVCESTQWVALGDFDRIERVPLSSWAERVESFDPRNDGWAAALSSLFVSGNTRRLYIPLFEQPFSLRGAALASRLSAQLGSLSWRLSLPSSTLPFPWILGGFLAVFLVAYLLSGRSAALLAIAPSLLYLCGSSGHGFAAAGFLAIACTFVYRAFDEYCRSGIWRFYLVAGVSSLALSLVSGFLSGIPFLALILAPVSALSSLAALSAGAEYRAQRLGHRRFLPIPLKLSPRSLLPASRLAIPFAAASCFLLLFTLLYGGGAPGALPAPKLAMDAYQAHISFQDGFSRRALVKDAGGNGHYDHFVVGSDGLLEVQTEKVPPFAIDDRELPPAERMVAHWGRGNSGGLSPVLSFLLISMMTIPAFLHQVRRRQQARLASAYSEKRIAA